MILIASSSAVMVEMLVRSSVERHARESIETAMMDPSDSVSTISNAVSQAAEHVETARARFSDAIKAALDGLRATQGFGRRQRRAGAAVVFGQRRSGILELHLIREFTQRIFCR
jgi:hypothetical protein